MNSKPATNRANDEHPNPMDRNRSIMWARYHMDSDEWVSLAVKVTRKPDEAGVQKPSVVTMALMNCHGETVLECMIKASQMVSNEEVAQHGVEYSVMYNAVSYEQALNELRNKIDGKTIVAWDVIQLQETFKELDEYYGAPVQKWTAHSAQKEWSRFVGHTRDVKNGYEMQPLPVLGMSAVDELRAVKKVMSDIAGSSQMNDELAGGKPGWTAEFYRPKVNPSDKLKGFFGLKS